MNGVDLRLAGTGPLAKGVVRIAALVRDSDYSGLEVRKRRAALLVLYPIARWFASGENTSARQGLVGCFVRWQNTVGHHAPERVTRSRTVASSCSSSNAFSGDSR